jgi:acyl carrier protein
MPETLTIEPRLRKIINDHLGGCESRPFAEDFPLESRMRQDLGADSLDQVELAMVIEDKFNIEITDEDVDRWKTAGDVLRCIEGKR